MRIVSVYFVGLLFGLLSAACGDSNTGARDAAAGQSGADAAGGTGGTIGQTGDATGQTGGTATPRLDGAAGKGGGPGDASAGGQLLATDGTTEKANTFEHNAWISGQFGSDDSADPYTPGATELRLTTLDATWFAAFPTTLAREPSGFAPSATAPRLDQGSLLPEVPTDRAGAARHAPTDLGPYER